MNNPLINLFKGGVISPTIGITMLKGQIERQTKVKISSFDLIHKIGSESMTFEVKTKAGENQKFEYRDPSNFLVDVIQKYLSQNLPKETELQAFAISLDENKKSIIRAFFTDNGIPQQVEIKV